MYKHRRRPSFSCKRRRLSLSALEKCNNNYNRVPGSSARSKFELPAPRIDISSTYSGAGETVAHKLKLVGKKNRRNICL